MRKQEVIESLGQRYATEYEQGWRYSQRDTANLGHLDTIGATTAMYERYEDYAVGHEKRHAAECSSVGPEYAPTPIHALCERRPPAHMHTFEPGTVVHVVGDPEGRDYTVVSHDYSATTLRQELPTGFAIRSISCWHRAEAVASEPRLNCERCHAVCSDLSDKHPLCIHCEREVVRDDR